MPIDYTEYQNLTTEMIAEFGQTAVLCRQGAPTGTGRKRRYAIIEVEVKVVDIGEETQVAADSDTSITAATRVRVLYMGVEAGVVPQVKDQIKMHPNTTLEDILTLSKVEAVSPGGDDVVYKLMVEV